VGQFEVLENEKSITVNQKGRLSVLLEKGVGGKSL